MRDKKPLSEYNLWQLYLRALIACGHFHGRATRSEFWGFAIFYTLFYAIWEYACVILTGNYAGILSILYQLIFLIPAASLMFRRLHDTGRSGWYTLPFWILTILSIIVLAKLVTPYDSSMTVIYILGLISLVLSAYVFLILAFFRSDPGQNEYGLNPYRSEKTLHKRAISTIEI